MSHLVQVVFFNLHYRLNFKAQEFSCNLPVAKANTIKLKSQYDCKNMSCICFYIAQIGILERKNISLMAYSLKQANRMHLVLIFR